MDTHALDWREHAWTHLLIPLACWCLILGLLFGCGAPPPRTIQVSPELPEAVQVAAARARDAWCLAPVGWCPELTTEPGDAFIEVRAYRGTSAGSRMRNNLGVAIQVQPDVAKWPADQITGAMTHEFGHFGIEDHVAKSALMRARFETSSDVPWDVDAEASDEWCAEQHGC